MSQTQISIFIIVLSLWHQIMSLNEFLASSSTLFLFVDNKQETKYTSQIRFVTLINDYTEGVFGLRKGVTNMFIY